LKESVPLGQTNALPGLTDSMVRSGSVSESKLIKVFKNLSRTSQSFCNRHGFKQNYDRNSEMVSKQNPQELTQSEIFDALKKSQIPLDRTLESKKKFQNFNQPKSCFERNSLVKHSQPNAFYPETHPSETLSPKPSPNLPSNQHLSQQGPPKKFPSHSLQSEDDFALGSI
jgi:hypothetical protein